MGLPITALAITQPSVPNAASVVAPITSSAWSLPRHHLDLPPGKEKLDQGTDADHGSAIEEAEISTKKIRKIHINIIIKINHNSCKTCPTSNQPSKPHARIQIK